MAYGAYVYTENAGGAGWHEKKGRGEGDATTTFGEEKKELAT